MRPIGLFLLLWLLAFGLPQLSFATHQVGGQLEMRAIGDRPGHYRIIVTNYLEDNVRAAMVSGGSLGIFRQRDNVQMTTFNVRETSRQPVIYTNAVCALARNLKFIVVTFEADLQLNPATYSDPAGYYMSYQTRNRNAGINNISNPLNTGFTFYLEFPPIQLNGSLLPNSSPHFGPINGEYICLGDPFTFPFGGTDPDGDELRYSMVTPLNQKGTNANTISAGPYPDVTWLAGFGPDNAVPGNPTLSIDSQTGQLSMTASQVGLFVFAIKVDEYRNGVKIGEVRRDFQFLVIDCAPSVPASPDAQILNQPLNVKQATICQGDSAVIQATADPNWNYQWRRNEINLSGATSSSLTVHESGEYTVYVSPKLACSKAGGSQTVSITVLHNGTELLKRGHLCATDGIVSLTAASGDNLTYQWYRNGQVLAGQTADSMQTTEPGLYWAIMKYPQLGCTFRSDSVSYVRSPVVTAVIQAGSNRLCPLDSLLLEASGGLSYSWQQDGIVVPELATAAYQAKAVGSYQVTAIDPDGCRGVSTPFVVVAIPPVTPVFDSIPPGCGPDAPILTLQGSPAGGTFGGTGVEGDLFVAKQAGVGSYTLTYTIKPAPECAEVVANRIAVVSPIPTIDMTHAITTYKGNSFSLTPAFTGEPNQFNWSPPTYLDDPTAGNPGIVAIGADIIYSLTATNQYGCQVTDSVNITVYERIWVPDAFTPNGDGLNDVWTLAGIDAYPDAEVTIYNRWGEVVYHTVKGYTIPFDGMYRGEALPQGVYVYRLETVPQKAVLRGSLNLIR